MNIWQSHERNKGWNYTRQILRIPRIIYLKNVEVKSNGHYIRVYTDGLIVYRNLENIGYEHRVINHFRGFGRGVETTNHIESIWSEMRRIGEFKKGFSARDIHKVRQKMKVTIWRIMNKKLIYVLYCLKF